MITLAKILGEGGIKPGAATPTVLYTVPASTQARGRLNICNQGVLADTIRIAITPSGRTIDVTDYIFYDCSIRGNSVIGDVMFDLPAGAFITVYSLLGQCSFISTGLEVS